MAAGPGRLYPRKDRAILEAADQLFMRDGYAGTSMNAVAAHADVAKQTLYSNFANKEALFAAVINRRTVRTIEVPPGVDLEDGELSQTLVALGAAFLTYIYSPHQVELFQTVVAEARAFPELGALMVNGPFAEVPSVIDAFLRQRIDRGEIDVASSSATEIFISLLKGNAHVRLLFNQPVDTSHSAILGMSERAVRHFLDGARPGRS